MKFMDIYDQYHDRVNKFIRSLVKDEFVTDDLVQETFLRVRNKIDTVREPEKLTSWIYRIAYNLCLDHFKAQKKDVLNGDELDSKSEPLIPDSFDLKLQQKEMGNCVQQQIDLLPEPLRTVLVMYDVLEFTHKEISEILNISEENSKVRLHRARKNFKEILKNKCTFEVDNRDVLVCEPLDQNKKSSS
jgi:RNA polymerase sigma-70 factor (ECF subfamily)